MKPWMWPCSLFCIYLQSTRCSRCPGVLARAQGARLENLIELSHAHATKRSTAVPHQTLVTKADPPQIRAAVPEGNSCSSDRVPILRAWNFWRKAKVGLSGKWNAVDALRGASIEALSAEFFSACKNEALVGRSGVKNPASPTSPLSSSSTRCLSTDPKWFLSWDLGSCAASPRC